MDQAEYNELVESLGDNEREMLREARRRGRATVAQLRPVTKSPTTGLPLAYGLTRELRTLQERGLIRRVARTNPRAYEPVPRAGVEKAAALYRPPKSRPPRRVTRARRDELRRYEQGDYSDFFRVHRRVHDLTEFVSQHITKMAYWTAAPKDDLARTADDLGDLLEAVHQALTCLKERADDDELLARIEKVETLGDGSGPEADTARAIAQKLRDQYDRSIGA